jgi:hypothetical protein
MDNQSAYTSGTFLPYMGNIRSRKYILGAGEIMGH